METESRLPLGLFKQALLKLESFADDIHEILEDPDINAEERNTLQAMSEYSATMAAHIINIIRVECDEEEFLAEEVPMDVIGSYPGDDMDIIDQEV